MTRLHHEVSIPGLLGQPSKPGTLLVLTDEGYVELAGSGGGPGDPAGPPHIPIEADRLLRYEPHPTGVYTGAGMTEAGTVLTVAAGTGVIVDSYTDQVDFTYLLVPWLEQTIDFGSVTDRQYSYPYIDNAGVLGFDIIRPLPDALRQRIYLGRAVHDIATGDLATSRPEHMLPGQTSQMFADLLYAIDVPFLFEGGKVAPNTDLTFATGDSRWFGPAESWQQDKNDPNIANNQGADPTTFQYIDALGVLTGGAITLVDPASFEEPLGTIIPIPGSVNRASIQRLYTSISGTYLMQYGQQWYDNLEEAINSINADNATFVTNPYIEGASATLVAYFVMEKGATDLADGTDVAIIDPAGIPIGGGGSGAHSHDATYVNLTGDTMTGLLVLSGDPAVALGAATKQYVDALPPPFSGDHADLTNVLTDQHHSRYTDAEAVIAVGPHTPAQTFLHDDLTDVTADQHHIKYTDAEAIAAVGPHTPAQTFLHDDLTDVVTDQHHTRYTDAEAEAAIDGIYLRLTGGTITGRITFSTAGSVSGLRLSDDTGGTITFSRRDNVGRMRLGGTINTFAVEGAGDVNKMSVSEAEAVITVPLTVAVIDMTAASPVGEVEFTSDLSTFRIDWTRTNAPSRWRWAIGGSGDLLLQRSTDGGGSYTTQETWAG